MTRPEPKIHTSERIGPWLREDCDSFLALDCELKPPPEVTRRVGLLASPVFGFHNYLSAPFEARQHLIGDGWMIRRRHPIYIYLFNDPSFKAAWGVFERQMKKAKDGKLTLQTTPFVFLREFVQFAKGAHLARSAVVRQKAGGYVKDRRAAIKHADALLRLMDGGLGLSNHFDNQRLGTLLRALSLDLIATDRKTYGGKGAIERSVLRSFALVMLVCCDLKSPAVVTHFADMVGLKCDEKKAQRYCNAAVRSMAQFAATDHGNAFASALLQSIGTPTK